MSGSLPDLPAAPGGIERVRLGHSDVYVTRLMLGCAPLAGMYAPVEGTRAEAVLEASWEEGVRAFDTAPQYGVGLSEERLGAFLADHAVGEAVVSTKVGHLLVDADDGVQDGDLFYGAPSRKLVNDYTKEGVRRSIADSLGRLGRDHVDVALIHDPDRYAGLALTEAYPALKELRDEGVVGAIGVAMNHADVLTWLVERTELDCVLVAGCYSLLDVPGGRSPLPCVSRTGGVGAGGWGLPQRHPRLPAPWNTPGLCPCTRFGHRASRPNPFRSAIATAFPWPRRPCSSSSRIRP